MPTDANAQSTGQQGVEAPGTPQCHFISNTHWDREWRYSMQRTRHMLVSMIDMLLDIFEKEPRFASFHMDSQSIPLQDYLEIRPEREETIRCLVREDRLMVGPWFVLPDEFCVGGESLIRNLLLGHRIAERLGKVTKTGYSPFSWGQISQMPQIYAGFGIPFAAFYRGINTIVSPNSEFIWEGPDGTRILGSRLACRPRYNAWYVLQRPVFWDFGDENARLVRWDAGHAPFRMADPEFAGLDMRYARPRFEYHHGHVPRRAAQTLSEQDGEWTTPHRFWSAGHDSSCPDIREVRLIDDCREALAGGADVFHSSFVDFQRGVREREGGGLPVARGEMRHSYTTGSSSALFGWITSARTDIKQENHLTEKLLGRYAEPMAVCAAFLGAGYPRGFLDHAWNWLLQNHGHDSIGCCSRDVVPADMRFRYRQAREIAGRVTEQAFMDIAGAIDLSGHEAGDVALVAWNALPRARSEIVELVLEIPQELDAADVELVDESGDPVRLQHLQTGDRFTVVQSPNDCANMMAMRRWHGYAELPELPSSGYRTFFACARGKRWGQSAGAATRPDTIENEFLEVRVQPNGALSVREKATGRSWRDLGYFRDSSETGNPWEHVPAAHDELITTLGERARVSRVLDGELVSSLRVEIDWRLPKGSTPDRSGRAAERVACPVVSKVTLRAGQPWVEIETTIDNRAEDHYLRVSFPTGVQADTVHAQTPFDVVERTIALPDPSLYAEALQPEQPMDRFVDIGDGTAGIALLNDGLKAYEAHDDADGTVSLTLLRCFPLRICITNLEMTDYPDDKGSQCLGRHTFRYAFMPHAGDWRTGRALQAAERFDSPVRVAQIGPSTGGHLPTTKSFLEVEPDEVDLSAMKQNEEGNGWIVRLFNPTGETISTRVRLNGGHAGPERTPSPVERQREDMALPGSTDEKWRSAGLVTLEEKPIEDLVVDGDGWAAVELGKKRIVTLEFIGG
ncbi:MAG: alpha-mannosidase [Planctomycetota bacterium]|jgi:hypothetical protein